MNSSVRWLFVLAAVVAVACPAHANAQRLRPLGQFGLATSLLESGCAVTHTGIDTVGADIALSVFNGRGEGQVVDLQDTLVASFTVYRAPFQDSLPYFGRLAVTNSDLNGRPVVSSIVYSGPIVQGPFGDGIHPLPWEFVIDPPLALPHRGLYYFNITESSCFIGTFYLLADTRDRYKAGSEWRTGESFCGPAPGSLASPGPTTTDLIFDIGTCELVTPVRRDTWGSLKILYR